MNTHQLTVESPTTRDTTALVRLFNDFRIFYGRDDDLLGAQAFVENLMREHFTRFFVAKTDTECVGFVHLIPYLDTLAMRTAWILEDLFVQPRMRRRGIGGALLRRAEELARATDAGRISLTTAHTNRTAQSVYVAHGYVLDEVFRTYHLELA